MGTESVVPRILAVGMENPAEVPGGLNRYLFELCTALRKLAVPVEAIVVSSSEPELPFVRVAPDDAPLWRRLAGMGREGRARLRSADVLNTHFALYALPVLLGAQRKPLVVTFHGPWHEEMALQAPGRRLAPRLAKLAEHFVYRRADELIVLSEAFRRVLAEDFGVFPGRLHVVPPGIGSDRFHPIERVEARQRLGLEVDGIHVLAVRRLAKRMGLDVLLRAWAEPGFAAAHLHVIGEGGEREALQDLARQLGIADRVRFWGRVSEDDLPSWYAAADVSVVPSVALEGFGLVVLESLACGTPVVASDTGGLAEVLPALAGDLLVPPGDHRSLARRMALALDDPSSLPSRAECRMFAEGFTWERAAASTLSVFEQARSKPPDRPFRVVYLDHTAKPSGGELALLRLLKGTRHVDAHVILAEDGPLRVMLEEAGISCEILELPSGVVNLARSTILSPGKLLRTLVASAAYGMRLAWRLRRLRPDVVHANSLKAGVIGIPAARLSGSRAVWHLHDRLSADNYPGAVAAAMRGAVRWLPDAVIANSAATAAALGSGRARVTVVPSPVDVSPSARRGKGVPVVGMVGRLAPWKGQDVFLEAFAKLLPQHPGLTGRIVGAALFGEDGYAQALRERAEQLGISDSVEFLGHRTDVATQLAGLTVAVHASKVPEPFGQVVVEAMMCGVAVVAAAAGGPSEVITDGSDGLLVEPGDADALCAAIDRLLRDEHLRDQLSAAGRATAERYRPEVVGVEVEEVYAQVLGRRADQNVDGRSGLTAPKKKNSAKSERSPQAG